MLMKIHRYRASLINFLLILYVCSTVNWNVYEIVHVCLHFNDIVNLEYSHHSHQNNQDIADHHHTHDHIFDQIGAEDSEQQFTSTLIGDEKTEFEIQVRVIFDLEKHDSREMIPLITPPVIQFMDTPYRPPKAC